MGERATDTPRLAGDIRDPNIRFTREERIALRLAVTDSKEVD